MMTGSILVTGGTGTLGQSIVRRASREGWNCSFTIYSRDEIKQQQMKRQFPECRYVIGDVADYDTLEKVTAGHSTVLHLAAFKHIPAGEVNVGAVMQTNVIGSWNVAKATIRQNVEKVLGISTDKACLPINTYGASKMIMERIFQEHDRAGLTEFHLCRYGNVLSSTGSVIPLWRAQSERGEPLTLTDPEMTRFWLTPDRAVDVALQALNEPRGTVTIPRLPSMSMLDFAMTLFPTASIKQTGIRPGEKKHEDLLSVMEGYRAHEGSDFYQLFPPDAQMTNDAPVAPYNSAIARRLTGAELLRMFECSQS